MTKTTSVLVLAASSLLLGGCQAWFGGPSFASGKPEVNLAAVDMSDYFAARLATGNAHLARGRPGHAVTAFRQASYDPAHAGRAYNGLGVAHAQMGRPDLARRYFAMALATDPSDERFARNLARTEGAARQDEARPEFAAVAATFTDRVPESGVGPTTAVVHNPRGSPLVRISAREVQIGSVEASTGPASRRTPVQTISTSRASLVPRRPIPSAPVQTASLSQPDYPIRLALSDSRIRPRATYPVRIELPVSK